MAELGRATRDRVENLECGNQLSGRIDLNLDAPATELLEVAGGLGGAVN